MLTKLIAYCSQHVRTADFASDCKMFGKPHAFPAASSIPSMPVSVAVVALTQNARSCCLKQCWVSYLQYQVHRIVEFLLIARYMTSLTKLAESFPPCLPPSLWISLSEAEARGDDLDVSCKCPPFHYPSSASYTPGTLLGSLPGSHTTLERL